MSSSARETGHSPCAWTALVAALLLPLALLFATDAPAQQRKAPPPRLFVGLGDLHHPVSTSNRLAQRFFNQGLTFVYAFNHQEAVRSFQRAAELDPKLAIAHWGMALALGPNYNSGMDSERAERARQALRRAEAIAAREPSTSAAERDYIAALQPRFAPSDASGVDPAEAYEVAMRALAQRYPDDPDAATLFADSMMTPRAWNLWNADGTPAPGTEEIVATLESVLARHPEHVGANHFYIHAIEASPNPGRGLPSADRLTRLAPAAGHLVHMPAHIYDRVGDHAAAARANKAAVEADDAYIRQLGSPNPYQRYYAHNLHFLAISYTNQGRYRDAIATAKAFAKRVAINVPGVPRLAEYMPAVALINVRFEKWDEIAKLPAPPEAYGALRAVWHFARGMAFAGRGRPNAARAERDALARTMAAIPADEMWGRSLAADVFGIAVGMLDASIAVLRNDTAGAIATLRRAAAAEDALAYDEPAVWYIPARESLARVLLATGDPAEAETVLRDELSRRPHSGRALFILAESQRRQLLDAAAVERDFERAWKDADTQPRIGGTAVSPLFGER